MRNAPEHVFVGKDALRARYGDQSRHWVDDYVQRAGFPGEIGNGLWRLDHVLKFELLRGGYIHSAQTETSTLGTEPSGEPAAPADSFVGIRDMMARYGRGKTWVCAFVAHDGFPGEIGLRLWRLDHVMAFEDSLGALVRTAPDIQPPNPILAVTEADPLEDDDDILTRRRNRRKAA